MTDYRELFLELFGTDDEKEIREEFDRLKKRNAGRKASITEDMEARIRYYASEGLKTSDIADKVSLSRQSVSKVLNQPPEEGYTIRMAYMFKNQICTIIDINYFEKKIKIQNRTDDIFHRAFGVNENPSWKDFEVFLESRCYSKSRADIGRILNELGMKTYDTYVMVEKTEGRCHGDDMWINISSYPRKREGIL